MVSFIVLEEENTRCHTKVCENGIVQIWIEYKIKGKTVRTRYGFNPKYIEDGSWRNRIMRDLNFKKKKLNVKNVMKKIGGDLNG